MLPIDAIRDALREVHRALIDVVRAQYEKEHGPVGGPAELLRLLTEDPFFEWLRPLSRVRTQSQPLYQSVTRDKYCVRAKRIRPSQPSARSQRANFRNAL